MSEVLSRLTEVLAERKSADPERSYVASLCKRGEDAILKKIAEEAAETLLAAKSGDTSHLIREAADLWFHTLVLLVYHGLGARDVLEELERREGVSGISEKVSRTDQE